MSGEDLSFVSINKLTDIIPFLIPTWTNRKQETNKPLDFIVDKNLIDIVFISSSPFRL